MSGVEPSRRSRTCQRTLSTLDGDYIVTGLQRFSRYTQILPSLRTNGSVGPRYEIPSVFIVCGSQNSLGWLT